MGKRILNKNLEVSKLDLSRIGVTVGYNGSTANSYVT